MQAIAPVTTDQLLAASQVPLMKLEIYVGAAWVNLSALDAKNYVESINISLGGARMTPNPVGGTVNAELSNEDSIFHPKHPTSAYKDYLKTGRKVRASIGATYGGEDYYWQRVIGYIDEPRFEALAQKVSISGADFMKLLQDTEFGNLDNYWGTEADPFDSISSDGLTGIELYNVADAMDITGEEDDVEGWSDHYCLFTSEEDAGGGSEYVGKAIIDEEPPTSPYIKNANVFTPEANTEYCFKFKYKIVTGINPLSVIINQHTNGGVEKIAEKMNLRKHVYTQESIYFTSVGTGEIEIRFVFYSLTANDEFRVDQFSIHEFIPYWDRHYQLPVGATGVYRVLLNDEDVWQGEEDEGWYYSPDAESGPDPPAHPARIVWFDPNKKVALGVGNIVIHYFEAEAPENVVADILVKANLYADRAAALADMEYDAYGSNIDRNWFKVGSTCLKAIKMLCERCDYRFHFKYDGTPVFKPKPAPETTVFTFTDQKHIASFSNYQDRNEVKNRIVIEGMKRAEPINKEETLPPELRGMAEDETSIATYGERTLTIKNHLFQTQAAINAMCIKLRDERKDPKWYTDVEVEYRPVPLELGDKMSWKERLSPVLEITKTGIIRDIKIDGFNTTYKCEDD